MDQDYRQVHLMRHGQVHNPDGVLYGRLPGYGLSDLGLAMADRMAEYWSTFELSHLRCSPLLRARETLAPTAAQFPDLPVTTDLRLIEAGNVFEGMEFGPSNRALRNPKMLRHVWNPFRPSWGEPYREVASRMRAAIADAAAAAGPGGQALLCSHQLPIWLARCDAEGVPLFHDPRRRECRLASVTSFTLRDGRITKVSYTEPAADLLPESSTAQRFRVGT